MRAIFGVLLPFLLAVVVFSGCTVSVNTSGDEEETEITSEIKSEINKIRAKVKKAFNQQNSSLFRSIAYGELGGTGNQGLVILSNVDQLLDWNKLKRIDHFYSKGVAGFKNFKGVADACNYTTSVQIPKTGTYVVTSTVPSRTDPHLDLFVMELYYKQGNDWKLSAIGIGDYSILNKNALKWYKNSKVDREKGEVLSAYLKAKMARQLMDLDNTNSYYDIQSELQLYLDETDLLFDQNFTLPMDISVGQTSLKIVDIAAEIDNTTLEVIPKFFYYTTLDMNDTLALQAECDELHALIGELYNGAQNFGTVSYEIRGEEPGEGKNADAFGIVKRKD